MLEVADVNGKLDRDKADWQTLVPESPFSLTRGIICSARRKRRRRTCVSTSIPTAELPGSGCSGELFDASQSTSWMRCRQQDVGAVFRSCCGSSRWVMEMVDAGRSVARRGDQGSR